MITNDDRATLSEGIIDLVEAIRAMAPGSTPERQIELVRESIALQLAGLMFAAEQGLKLGPRTEALRVTDRAHALFDIQAEQRRKLGIGR